MICRAEQRSIMLISSNFQQIIPFERYSLVENYLKNGENNNAFLIGLDKRGFLTWMRENASTVLQQMKLSNNTISPINSYAAPVLLNFELTSRCPLRCPQCYCDLSKGKDLPFDIAKDVLKQAAELGVSHINLSGGETMLYPHLYELVKECSSLGMHTAVALSGYGVDEISVRRLIESGIDQIYVSLNGSTEEISRATRNGHQLAIRALELLSAIGFKNVSVNWVAHQSNADDFENMVNICKGLGVKKIVVMAFKPDSSHRLNSAPGKEQLLMLAQNIKLQRDSFPIIVESCYSPLRALLGQKYLLNINRGISKGCGAGRDGASLDVDGNFTPCRHLDFPENFRSLKEYWYKSDVLKKLRTVEDRTGEPCSDCRYEPYCLSCLAVSVKLNGRIDKANQYCPLSTDSRMLSV